MDEAIYARATPGGASAIAIIRVSGAGLRVILPELFQPVRASWKKVFGDRRPFLGDFVGGGGRLVDSGLLIFWAAPRSYTGEDVAELHLHGSDSIVSSISRRLGQLGVRPARPGEFTKRAYLNGKMDLLQAEAVMSLISAQTERGAEIARRSLDGRLGHRLGIARNHCLDVLKWLEMRIDFPEEDQGEVEDVELLQKLERASLVLSEIHRGAQAGETMSGVPSVVLLGAPNAGKSSLFNTIVGSERAIVTDIPGTTRDVLNDVLVLGGCRVEVLDTAGLRQTDDPVEKVGVRLAQATASRANVRLMVVDASAELDSSTEGLLDMLCTDTDIIAANKVDLGLCPETVHTLRSWGRVCPVSARTGEGIGQLVSLLERLTQPTDDLEDVAISVAKWQLLAIGACALEVSEAEDCLVSGSDAEVTAYHLRSALSALDEITGRDAGEDLLDDIFASFCLGK